MPAAKKVTKEAIIDAAVEVLREAFRREFRALIAIYGKPAKLPEFAVKAGVVL